MIMGLMFTVLLFGVYVDVCPIAKWCTHTHTHTYIYISCNKGTHGLSDLYL